MIETVHTSLVQSGKKLALAESCTGGAIAAALTAIPGASIFLLGSLVVYSNEWKTLFLDVSPETLRVKGAVSAETVEEMVLGLFARTTCDIAAAISGIAGPSGGTPEKPVGTIYIATALRGEKIRVQHLFEPKNREAAIAFTIQETLRAIHELSAH